MECRSDNDRDVDQLVVSKYVGSRIDSYCIRQEKMGSASSVYLSCCSIVARPSMRRGYDVVFSYFPSVQYKPMHS